MNNNKYTVRLEKEPEFRTVENLVRESFWNIYRPGCTEHYVLKCLRSNADFVPELDFVLEQDGEIIGQNLFVRATLKSDRGDLLPVLTMGPICIRPDLQRKGYGKILLDETLQKAKAWGCGAVCLEGNLLFYGKSGFRCAREYGIRYHDLPADADSSFFLCKELIPGYLDGFSGEYATPTGYFAAMENPEDFEAYDATFPRKEKLILPGQLS